MPGKNRRKNSVSAPLANERTASTRQEQAAVYPSVPNDSKSSMMIKWRNGMIVGPWGAVLSAWAMLLGAFVYVCYSAVSGHGPGQLLTWFGIVR